MQWNTRGFTLPELLVTGVAVSVLLATAMLVAHPRDFSVERRNAERWAEVAHIAQLLVRYQRDHGALPRGITEKLQPIGSELEMVDLCPVLVPAYVRDLPLDPQYGAKSSPTCAIKRDDHFNIYGADYSVAKTPENKLVVSAPGGEGETIVIMRQL